MVEEKKVPTAEEIAAVKAEFEEKKKKKEAQEKEKKLKEKSDEDSTKTDSAADKEKTTASMPPSVTPSPAPAGPSHKKYALHRDYYASKSTEESQSVQSSSVAERFLVVRQTEHRKRRQAAQAKILAPRLPGVPRNGVD